jgi:hypothetical protein
MRKIILALLVITGLATAGSFGQLGLAYSQGENEGDYATGFAGVNVLGNLGLRLEYTKNISENPEFSKEDISRYGLFATYTLPLTSAFSVTPKAGITKVDGSITLKDATESVTNDSTEFTYGLELNYHYNNQLLFYVGYTDYGQELDLKNIDTDKLDTQNYTFGIKLEI